MNTNQIEIVLTLADSMSYRKAAEVLYMSPSTISRQIQALEEEIGVVIFHRGNNFVRLTPAGALVVQHFGEMQKKTLEVFEQAKNVESGVEGTIRIGYFYYSEGESLLRRAISEFKEKQPKSHLKFQCYEPGKQEQSLINGDSDVIFTHDYIVEDNQNLLMDVVCKKKSQIAVGKYHPLAERGESGLYYLKDETIWIIEEYNNRKNLEQIQKVCNYYGMENCKTKIAPNWETALCNTEFGEGMLIADQMVLSVNPNHFRKFELPEEISSGNIVVSWRKDNLNPIVPHFLATLDHIKEKLEL